MSNQDPYVERTVTETPSTVRREEVRAGGGRSEGSNAGWWVAALVAVIAIVGLFFVFNANTAGEADLQAARETGRAEAMLDNATAQAQQAAADASRASSNAAASMAAAGQSAADSAATAAERTAEATEQAASNAGQAAEDAAATVTVTTPEPQ